MRKVVYVGGQCEFCTYLYENYAPHACKTPEEQYVMGRAYTIVYESKIQVDGRLGVGVRTAEVPLQPHWMSCSCMFRDVDGDAEEWRRTASKHKPKELLPV